MMIRGRFEIDVVSSGCAKGDQFQMGCRLNGRTVENTFVAYNDISRTNSLRYGRRFAELMPVPASQAGTQAASIQVATIDCFQVKKYAFFERASHSAGVNHLTVVATLTASIPTALAASRMVTRDSVSASG